MANWWLKLVPNVEPNANGEWEKFDLGVVLPSFNFTPRSGYHVVRFIRAVEQPVCMGSSVTDDITFSVYPDMRTK